MKNQILVFRHDLKGDQYLTFVLITFPWPAHESSFFNGSPYSISALLHLDTKKCLKSFNIEETIEFRQDE